ncbi:hypothetical protein DFH08DRAFT_886287 [Mycena albidolilacea]|uniref:Uncharacterized protein n=1 Tax=Mycena albidolilacea TaxID=1033008 RepID=A0AAD6ZKD6_9AGAR|nr:hypothetical protein DFH08DRAFT_886287 [Mycena albidolilacea]
MAHGLGPLGSSSFFPNSIYAPSRSSSLSHGFRRAQSTASSLSTRTSTSASGSSGFGMQDEDNGSCSSPSSPYFSNQDFGSPSAGMGWHMGSASPDPLVSKVEMLSAELGNVKASLSPLDSKLDQLLDLLRNPRDPKHAAWIHDAGVAFLQQPRIAPGSPQLVELQQMYPAVEIWDLEDFKEIKDDVRRVSRGGAHSRICVIMLINYLRKKA